ncbi:MAG: hypothetical protein ACRDAI_07695 [Candidatus Rhabdochlamydia sp.]
MFKIVSQTNSKIFQEACKNYEICTSFHATETKDISPIGNDSQKMIVRFWADNGRKFNYDVADQDGSTVFDPENGRLTYPNEDQLLKLDTRVQDCISKFWICLKEQLPMTEPKVLNIIDGTVVKKTSSESQSEISVLSSQRSNASIEAFQKTCKDYEICTSFHITKAKNISPAGNNTQKMIIRFWADHGKKFNPDLANQDGSTVFDPENGRLTYPNEDQLLELDVKVQDCISKFWICLKEQLPITEPQILNIIDGTVVKKMSSEPQTV